MCALLFDENLDCFVFIFNPLNTEFFVLMPNKWPSAIKGLNTIFLKNTLTS